MASRAKTADRQSVLKKLLPLLKKHYKVAVCKLDRPVMETMLYADEIRATEDLEVPGEIEIGEKELKMAKSLVDMLTGDFEPEKYHDNYREALLELIERKSEGEEIKRLAMGRIFDAWAYDAIRDALLKVAPDRFAQAIRQRDVERGRRMLGR